MNIKEKYCWLCKHIEIDSGWGGTEITPGDPSTFKCDKGHWNLLKGMYEGDAQSLHKCLKTAQTCKDWVPLDAIEEGGE
ncbi:MAG: hypothetical protein ACYTBJ_26420 [Planctomycetota bacterium]|jgi:hypothetical protein